MKPEVYCQVKFLDHFFAALPQDSLADLLLSKGKQNYRYLMDLYELIYQKSTLLIDLNQEEFEQLAQVNPYVRELLRSSLTGGSEVIPLKEQFDLMERDPDYFRTGNFIQGLFLLDKDQNFCQELIEKYGYIFVSHDASDMVRKAHMLFQVHAITLSKKDPQSPKNWDFIQAFRHPCNAMIIIDGYLLDETHNVIKENLITLLSQLLPKRLQAMDFHLSLITNQKMNNKKRSDTYHYVKKALSKMHLPYKVDLFIGFVRNNKVIHNRHIFTNYYWINSDYGFNCFKHRKVHNETPLTIFPYHYSSPKDPPVVEFMDQYLRQTLRPVVVGLRSNQPLKHVGHEGLGVKRNRLLGI